MPKNTPKSATTIKASEEVGSLNDLLTQILIKLPIKSLLCCKLVNKNWLSLINRQFSVSRYPSPNPATGIFLRNKDKIDKTYRYNYISLHPNSFSKPPPFNLDFTTNPTFTTVLHSCTLLLCASDTGKPSIRSMYVYNPTTNASTTLPYFPMGIPSGATLVFDYVKSLHYKVVTVAAMLWSFAGQVHVYSSKTGGWSFCAEIGTEEHRGVNVEDGVYWNGSVHWLIRELLPENTKMSLRFHVDTGMLEKMPSPPVVRNHIWPHRINYYFGKSCDHLHFVEPVLPIFNVYEMKKDYSEWFFKYKVDLSVFIGDHPEVIKAGRDGRNNYVIYVLSLVRGENELVFRIPGKVVKVNLMDGTSEKLCDTMDDNIHCIFSIDGHSQMFYFYGESGLDYIPSIHSV